MAFEEMNKWREGGEGDMQQKIEGHMGLDDEDEEENKYREDTFCGKLAANKIFEFVTIGLICLNAVIIGHDAEYTAVIGKPDNLYEGPIGFIVMENIFAVFFVFEIVVRFIGYKKKDPRMAGCCWRDGWFLFDSVLVVLMVLETYVLPFLSGNAPPLGPLRLLRLLRISRMAKLMRAVPELMTIVKGLATAVKAVGSTAVLLILVTYTFAIIFTSVYHQGTMPDNYDDITDVTVNFGSMGKSFFSLIIFGAIYDDLTYCTDSIRASESPGMLFVFIAYMIVAGFTVLNMLIGILAEVVTATSEREKGNKKIKDLSSAIMSIARELDKDKNGVITRSEFGLIKKKKNVLDTLNGLGVDEAMFEKFGEVVFMENATDDGSEPAIKYADLIHIVLRLRPDKQVSALDFATFQHRMHAAMKNFSVKLRKLDKVGAMMCGELSTEDARSLSQTLLCEEMSPVSPCSNGQKPRTTSFSADEATRDELNRTVPTKVEDDRWAQLSYADLLEEVQRRFKVKDAPGGPYEVTVEHESIPSSAHEAFVGPTLGVPEDGGAK